jgi:gliding motility-associated-like protein
MKKILLLCIPLLVIVGAAIAQPDLSVFSISAGAPGCSLSATQNVVILVQNKGTTNLSNVSFNLSYTLNGGAAVTEPVSFPVLPINQIQSYTFTTPANLSVPGVYNFVGYSSGLIGDLNQTNDTAFATLTNTSSVGGTVTGSATVCEGSNSGIVTLNGNTGAVQHWETSPDGITWTNVGHGGFTTDTYTNLIDTTYYRAIVKNGTCAIDSSTAAKITVTPIPHLSSTLSTGVCDGSTFTYTATSIYFSPTFTWTKFFTPWTDITDTGSVSGNWNPIVNVFHTNTDSCEHYAYYKITTTSNGCSNSGEIITIRVDSLKPFAAGTITSLFPVVCQNTTDSSYSIPSLSSCVSGHAVNYLWSYTGTGAFEFLNGPGASFTTFGSSTNLYFSPTSTSGNLTVKAQNYCGSGAPSPAYPITVDTAATANAGAFDSICQSPTPTPYVLNGSSVGGPFGTVGTWSILAGGGSLSLLTATNTPDTVTYTPAANFVGTVTLRLTTDNPPGVCGAVHSDRTIRLDTTAIAIAGGPDVLCQSSAPGLLTLNGSSVGGAYGTVGTWSISSGGGTLSGLTATNTPDTVTYTPVANFTGTVTLLLTTNSPGAPCGPIVSTRTITVNPLALVSAGADDVICGGNTYQLAGTRGGGATTSTWTTLGDGAFNDPTIVNPIYTPGPADSTGGTVTLIITTNDPAGPCSSIADSMILTINPPAIVNAGLNDTICAGNTYFLSGSRGGSATASTWTTSGDGVFSDSSLVNAVYTPGVADIAGGNVFLIITSNDPAGICSAVLDSMQLTINSATTVSAGNDTVICGGSNYQLAGSIGGGATSATWTTHGDGTFDNAALLNATYTPGATDISGGTVTLLITTNDPAGPCSVVADSMVLTINPQATVSAGIDDSICVNGIYPLSGTRGGSATSSTWTTSGDGTFNDATLVNAIYTPGATDKTNGTVFLIITTNDPVGICTAVVDSMTLSIKPLPIVTITDPVAVCAPSTVNLSLPAVTAGSTVGLTYSYYTNAGATIHPADSSAITASGTYYIVGTTAFGCSSAIMPVHVIVNPTAVGGTVGNDAIVCPNANADTLTLTGYVGAIQKWQSSIDGGITWVDIANTTPQLYYSNLTTTTWFRAEMTATCASATSVEARVTVDSHPMPVGGTVLPNDTVCSGTNLGTLTLTGNTGNVVRWEYSIDGANTWVYVNDITNVLVYNNITNTTIYHAILQNGVCYSATTSSNDTVTVTPVTRGGTISGAAPGCVFANGGTLSLSNSAGSVVKWQYSIDAGAHWIDSTNTTHSQVYANLPDTTLYRVIVKNGVCPIDSSAIATVIVYPKPHSAFTADTVCVGHVTTFTNTSTVTPGVIQFNQWYFGDNTTSLSVNPTHLYPIGTDTVSLVTTSNFGCLDTVTSNVLVKSLPNPLITSNGSLSFCCGGNVILSAATVGFNYLWSPGAGTTQSITISDCAASGNYQLTVTDPVTACSNTSSVAVVVFPLPTANAGNDTTINSGTSFTLNGQGGLTYLWAPTIGLTNPNIFNTTASPVVTSIYELTVTDVNGCTDNDSITITVTETFNNVVVTTLITANGDGFNDTWVIKNIEEYPGTEVIVINREGQQVYYSSAYDNTWNGLNKDGKPLPDGTYYYFIKFRDNPKVYKGPITILKEK